MTHRLTHRGAAGIGTILMLTLAILAAACGGEEVEVTTTPATTSTTTATTTTTAATTTTGAAATTISQIDLLSGMLQGLLTADEVTAAMGTEPGLVDQGRQIIPAGSDQRTGFLCPAGQAILDPLGSAYDPQVSVSFAPEGESGRSAWVAESLLYEEAGQNATDFATLVSAIDACAGSDAWTTPDAGLVRIERLDFPAMGDESYAYRVTFNEGTDQAPQMETKAIAIRVGPGLLEVSANMILDAPEPTAIGDGGLQDFAEAALAKIEEGLAGSEPFTVEPADPETLMYYWGLLVSLLTTEEIGGGWGDQGRMIVPPSAGGQGFGRDVLCPEGQAIYEPIGFGLDQQVFTTYSREGSPSVGEYLVWGHRDRLTQAFATSVAALEACFDREPWETEDAGTLRMHALDLPSLGAQSIAYYVGPGTTPGADPWVEWQIVSILVTNLDPANDNSVVISIAVSTIHDPAGAAVEMLDPEEIVRIAEAAIARFEYDG